MLSLCVYYDLYGKNDDLIRPKCCGKIEYFKSIKRRLCLKSYHECQLFLLLDKKKLNPETFVVLLSFSELQYSALFKPSYFYQWHSNVPKIAFKASPH